MATIKEILYKPVPKPLVVAVFCGLMSLVAVSDAAINGDSASKQLASQSDDDEDENEETTKVVTNANAGSGLPAGYATTGQSGVIGDGKGGVDQAVLNKFQSTGRLGSIVQDVGLPVDDSGVQIAGRYGEARRRGSGEKANGFHDGLDMSHGYDFHTNRIIAPVDSKIYRTEKWGSTLTDTTFQRSPQEGGDVISYYHTEYNQTYKDNGQKVKVGDAVSKGRVLGFVGNHGCGDGCAYHLHFTYAIPSNQQNRLRNFWLGKRTRFASGPLTGGLLNTGEYFAHPNQDTIRARSGGLFYSTDPTPYMDRDYRRQTPDAYTPYLGSSIRQQFNALYGTNLAVNSSYATSTKPIPQIVYDARTKLGTVGPLTPEQIAQNRMGVLNGTLAAESGGYNTGGYISYQVLSTFLNNNDGNTFGTTAPLVTPARFDQMSIRQIVDNIGNDRYGNHGWNKEMITLSTKGLMSEYVEMTAEENFLAMENQRMKNRVEMLIAGLTQARLFEFNKKIQALQVMAKANAVPSMINLKLEGGDEFETVNVAGTPMAGLDINSLPNDLQGLMHALGSAIANGESRGYPDAFNTGTNGKKGCPITSYFADAKTAGDKAVTDMTIYEIWYSGKTHPPCKRDPNRKSANGLYQHMWYTLGGKANSGGNGGFLGKFPQYKNVKFTPEIQNFVLFNFSLKSSRPTAYHFLSTGEGMESAINSMASEWSSICKTNGTGANAHMASNKCNPKTSKDVYAVMYKIRDWYAKNGGSSNKTSYLDATKD